MGKRLTKSEKLDLILSGLAKLRGEVRKLVRDADQGVKAKPRSLPKQTGARKKPDRDVAPSKPVLVQASQVPQSTSRTASKLPPQTAADDTTLAQSSRKSR
jgi:hypothetical protein